jgi:hypothetical protein
MRFGRCILQNMKDLDILWANLGSQRVSANAVDGVADLLVTVAISSHVVITRKLMKGD